ncbi:MAG TPA: M56 family metallopeptidase [Phycisphaerae bacterium]|nr:M48 family metalloprotease [Phycisphaerae bacterium]HPU34904.1 M56 family metallopeptidase [Phycisphaerae bacterium]HXK86762.1 M56 family metallopeptidase [Phycisphaerae bacterium]
MAGRRLINSLTSEMPVLHKAGETPAPPEAAGSAGWGRAVVERLEPYLPWFVVVWLVGMSVLSLRLLGGWVQVQKIRRDRSGEISDWKLQISEARAAVAELAKRLRVSRPVRLLVSAEAQAPMAIGWLRPVILLPASAITGLTPEQLRAVLAHELAHIRRYDYLVNILQSVVETVLFYHPAVWWVSRRIRVEREHCCDDMAVAVSGNVLSYARALERMELLRAEPARLAVAATSGSLLARIRRLVGMPKSDVDRSTGWTADLIAMGMVLVIAAGVHLAAFASSPTVADGNKDDNSGSAFRKILPSGISIELLAVAESPTGSAGWWRPDGSKLEVAPYQRSTPEPVHAPTDKRYKFAFRVIGGDPRDLRYKFADTRIGMTVMNILDARGAVLEDNDIGAVSAAMPADVEGELDLEVGVPVGEPETVASQPPDRMIPATYEDGGVVFHKPREKAGGFELEVAYTDHEPQRESYVVAYDKAGKAYRATGSTHAKARGFVSATLDFGNLPLEKLDRVELKTQTIEWAKFRRVPLKPGKKVPTTTAVATQDIRRESSRIVSTRPAGADRGRAEGRVELDRQIPMSLTAPAGERYTASTKWIEFSRASGHWRAGIHVDCSSWPKTRWRASVEILGDDGRVLRQGSAELENCGIIPSLILQESQVLDVPLGPDSEGIEGRRFAVSFKAVSPERQASTGNTATEPTPAIAKEGITSTAPASGGQATASTQPSTQDLRDEIGRLKLAFAFAHEQQMKALNYRQNQGVWGVRTAGVKLMAAQYYHEFYRRFGFDPPAAYPVNKQAYEALRARWQSAQGDATRAALLKELQEQADKWVAEAEKAAMESKQESKLPEKTAEAAVEAGKTAFLAGKMANYPLASAPRRADVDRFTLDYLKKHQQLLPKGQVPLAGHISGRLHDQQGKPIEGEGLAVIILPRDGKPTFASPDAEGLFSSPPLPAGRYSVVAFRAQTPKGVSSPWSKGTNKAEDWSKGPGEVLGYRHDVEVVAGQTAKRDLQPPGSETLEVTLEKPEGHLEWGIAFVALSPIDLGEERTTAIKYPRDLLGFFFIEPGKPYQIRNLPAETVHVLCTPSDPGSLGFSESKAVEIKAGQKATVALRLLPHGAKADTAKAPPPVPPDK